MTMYSNLNKIKKSTGEDIKVLGRTFKGFKVLPSSKLFYYRFPYKLRLIGNSSFYNIPRYTELNDYLVNNFLFEFRTIASTSNINLYLTKFSNFEKVIDEFSDLILDLSGPIDEDNLNIIDELNPKIAYRNKYWYSKYDMKIEFFISYSMEDKEKTRTNIFSFVNNNFIDYQWYNAQSNKWYENYLYCKSEEYNEVLPFLKINFAEFIANTQKVKLY